MNIDFYQITEIYVNNHTYYCIWFSGDCEGIIADSNKLIIFNSISETKTYASRQHISLDEAMYQLNADKVEHWAKGTNNTVDCVEIINFWNFIQDISSSNNSCFLGNKRTTEIDGIYNKLFCGNNIFVDRQEERYLPQWSKHEIKLIKKIIRDGVRIVKAACCYT